MRHGLHCCRLASALTRCHALQEGLAAAPGAQVVLLGAGLDSRAWRCAPPQNTPLAAGVFELDRADVLVRNVSTHAPRNGGSSHRRGRASAAPHACHCS